MAKMVRMVKMVHMMERMVQMPGQQSLGKMVAQPICELKGYPMINRQ
jgi:hypothetical protein